MTGAIAAAAFLIGFGKGGVAGGAGPFVTVLVALTLPADVALALILPMLLVGDAFAVAGYWRAWDGAVLRRLLPGAIVGIVVGAVTISLISEPTLRRLMAVVMLAFAASVIVGHRVVVPPRLQQPFSLVAGFTSGWSSTVAHIGGAPIVMYLFSIDISPRVFIATQALFFAVLNVIKIPAYGFAGAFDWHLVATTAWTWMLIPLGVAAGRLMIRHISPESFRRITLALLVIGALVLLFA
jgi:hypothetical protein